MKKSLFLFFIILTLPRLQAQMFEVGAGVGGLNYKGDVLPKYKPFVVGPGANIFGRLNYSRSLSIKANIVIGQIHGHDYDINDLFHRARGFNFTASVLELGGQFEYNFMNFRTNSSRDANNWTPYVFGGAASTRRATNFNIKYLNSATLSNYYYGKGYSDTRTNSWILGIGFKKELGARLNWGMEFGTRWINDDYLDGLGYNSAGEYNTPTPISAVNDQERYKQKIQVPGTRAKDMYYYTNFTISYLFYKVYCPPTRR